MKGKLPTEKNIQQSTPYLRLFEEVDPSVLKLEQSLLLGAGARGEEEADLD